MAWVRSSEQPAGRPERIRTIVLLNNQPPASTLQSRHKRRHWQETRGKRVTILVCCQCTASNEHVLESLMYNRLRKNAKDPLIEPEASRWHRLCCKSRVEMKIICRRMNFSIICHLTSDSDSHVVAPPWRRRNKSERNTQRTAADLPEHDPSNVHAQMHTGAGDV